MLSSMKNTDRLKSVLFEHRTEDVDRDRLVTCYEWVRSIVESL